MKFSLARTSTFSCIAVAVSAVSVLTGRTVDAYVDPAPVANVTMIDVTSAPDSFYFQLDAAAANCPANTFLRWEGGAAFPRGLADDSPQKSNVRSTMHALIAQKATGSKVRVYATNSTAATVGYFVVEFIHLL